MDRRGGCAGTRARLSRSGPMASEEIVVRWFTLTRETMPALAGPRGWPVCDDHCFQRILLDNALGRPWREVLAAPAYRTASDAQLMMAVSLGEAVVADKENLHRLNRYSLELRGKLRQPAPQR